MGVEIFLSSVKIKPRTGLCVYSSPVMLYILMTEILSNYEDGDQDIEAGPPKLLDNLNYKSSC